MTTDPFDLSVFKGSVSKDAQLARGEKRHHRKVASKARWQKIVEAKGGPCRVCRSPGPVSFHHVCPRSLGGSDTEANVVPLCGSGTTGCHGLIEARDRQACKQLRLSLTDAEYAYACGFGEGFLDRRYPIAWEKP